jgi:hypothetical protein
MIILVKIVEYEIDDDYYIKYRIEYPYFFLRNII